MEVPDWFSTVVASSDIPPKDFAGLSGIAHPVEGCPVRVSSSVQAFVNSQGYICLGLTVMGDGDGYFFYFSFVTT